MVSYSRWNRKLACSISLIFNQTQTNPNSWIIPKNTPKKPQTKNTGKYLFHNFSLSLESMISSFAQTPHWYWTQAIRGWNDQDWHSNYEMMVVSFSLEFGCKTEFRRNYSNYLAPFSRQYWLEMTCSTLILTYFYHPFLKFI